MAVIDVTKKLHIYHTLCCLNRSFSEIVTHCQTLHDAGVFKSKSTRLFQGFAQELQAEMNQELLEIMHEIELEDWNRFGKVRQARERELKNPADVSAKTKRRRQGPHKKSEHKA